MTLDKASLNTGNMQLQFKKDPEPAGITLTTNPTTEVNKNNKTGVALEKDLALVNSYGVELTSQDKAAIDAYSNQIDICNAGHVIGYGADSQKRMAEFSDSMLSSVKTKDTEYISEQISGLVTKLNSIDEKPKGFMGKLFKRADNTVTKLRAGYSSILANIDNISQNLQNHQITLYQDVARLDQLYNLNLEYFKEITMYIIAGKLALEKANAKASELQSKAQRSSLPEDAQAYNDYNNMIVRFERKLHDLELTRNQSLQMGPQIRLIQNNDTMLIEKIQTVVVNTIPLWKNQMIITLGLENAKRALESQRAVTDATNDMMRRNAEMLHMGSVDVAREMERGIVDLETLKHTNQELINTLDEVCKIQSDGRAKRMEAERELQTFEGDLKNRLLQMANNR